MSFFGRRFIANLSSSSVNQRPTAAPRTSNKAILRGYVGGEPEFRSFNTKPDENPKPDAETRGVWAFSLATSRKYKKNDEWQEETQWHRIQAYSNATDSAFLQGRISKG
ncbi:hypothetical protein HDU76_010910, partial [Blyttiomyces sp. JEL0837]